MGGTYRTPIVIVLVLSLVISAVAEGAGQDGFLTGDVPRVNVLGKGSFDTVSAAVQAASPGDIIFVGPGVYDEPVIVDKAVTLIGEGPSTVYTSTWFVSAAATIENHTFQNIYNGDWNHAAGITTLPAGTAMNVIKGVTVRNCTFQNLQHGVYLFGAANCVIENCTFTNSWRGVSIQNHDPIQNLRLSSYNTIRNCTFTNMIEHNGAEGEAVAINNTDYNTVKNCTIDNCPWGVMICKGDYNTVEDCTIVNSSKDALYLCEITTKVTVHNNTIRNNTGCVDFRKCSNFVFTENSIDNCTAPISVIDSSGFTIHNNTIDGSTLLLKRSMGGTITSNAFSSTNLRSIDFVATSKNHYSHSIEPSNEVAGSPIYYFFDRADASVSDVLAATIMFAYCINPTVRWCDLIDGDGIILVSSPNCNITANVTNCLLGIDAVDSGGGRLDECIIQTSIRGRNGIRLRDSVELTVHDSKIMTTSGKPAWRLEGGDFYRCYNTTFPYNSVVANLNSGGELWVYSDLTVRVLKNETLVPMAGVEARLTQDDVAVHTSPHFGGADAVTDENGKLGPITLLDRIYKNFHIPIEHVHDLDLWLGASATWSKAVRGINMSFDRLLQYETADIWRPNTPGGFTVKDVPAEDAIEVTWKLNGNDTVMYNLWSDITGDWALLDSVAASVDTYRIDQGLVHDGFYTFALSAVDEVPLESKRTGNVTVIHVDGLPPATPAGLMATDVKGTDLTLEWQANTDDDLEGYRIYVNASGGGASGPWVLLTPATGFMATTLWVQGLASETAYHFVVAAVDERPNESPRSQVLSVNTADITPPKAPVLDTPPGYTNLASYPVTGTAEPGSTLRLLLGGLVVEEEVVPGTGRFSVSVTLADGVNVLTARCIDPSGNVGPLSAQVSTILDREAPPAPALVGVPDLTNEAVQVITGTSEAFSQVKVFLNDEVVDTVDVGADGEFEVTISLTEGMNTLTAEATDRALNTGMRSPAIPVLLDTIAPDMPTMDPLPEFTNRSELEVTGTAEPSSLVRLFVGGIASASTTAGTDGRYSFDLVLTGRQTVVFVQATDAAGNVGEITATRTVILDQKPPSAAAGEDIEAVEKEEVRFDGTVSTDNEGIASYSWSFELDGVEVTLVGNSPTYTFQKPVTLTVTLTVTDMAGNAGQDAVEVVIRVDNLPPILRRDTFTPIKGNTDTKFTFSVEFKDDDGDTGEVFVVIDGESFPMTADPDDTDTSDGQTFTYVTKLTQGEHSYYFTGRDSFGFDAGGPSAGDGNARTSPDIDKKEVSSTPGPGVTVTLLAMLIVAALGRGRRPARRRK